MHEYTHTHTGWFLTSHLPFTNKVIHLYTYACNCIHSAVFVCVAIFIVVYIVYIGSALVLVIRRRRRRDTEKRKPKEELPPHLASGHLAEETDNFFVWSNFSNLRHVIHPVILASFGYILLVRHHFVSFSIWAFCVIQTPMINTLPSGVLI